MKRYSVILIFLFLSGCKHQEPLQPQIDNPNEMTALLNNKFWQSSIVYGINLTQNRYDILGDVYNGDSVQRESLFLHNMTKSFAKNLFTNIVYTNTYTDSLMANFFTLIDDGDVGCDYYMVVDSTDSLGNYLQITEEADNFNEIWGIFNVTVIRTDSCFGSNYCDTLRFRDGKFHVKLE